MGCRCNNKRSPVGVNIMDGYKYLKPHQIKARLEVFKRKFCSNCNDRYICDYNMYLQCTNRPR